MTTERAKTIFGSLYDYDTTGGTVIPLTSSVQAKVSEAFGEIFGSDFGTDAETPSGRLIEAISYLFKDVLAVNAQNANRVNPRFALGEYLDQLGLLFGVEREDDEGDTSFRKRILASVSAGTGYAASIHNRLGKVANTANIVVLDNGNEDPAMLPLDGNGRAYDHSIEVAPHSVFIALSNKSETDTFIPKEVAEAIRESKSAGCGFSVDERCEKVERITVVDAATKTSFTAVYCIPKRLYCNITVRVRADAYPGSDIVTDTKNAVVDYMNEQSICTTITTEDIETAIALAGKNIITESVSFKIGDDEAEIDESVENIVIPPYRYVKLSVDNVIVGIV